MVELRLDSNDNAFLPDNDTVYVDEGQFIPRDGKCQIFYTDQYQQTKFYPEKSA